MPPSAASRSTSVTGWPALASVSAAVMPATPPPMTSTPDATSALTGWCGWRSALRATPMRITSSALAVARCGLVLMHPSAALADVHHLDQVAVPAGLLASRLEVLRHQARGAAGHQHTSRGLLVGWPSDGLHAIRRAGVAQPLGEGYARQLLCALPQAGRIQVEAIWSPQSQMKTPSLGVAHGTASCANTTAMSANCRSW